MGLLLRQLEDTVESGKLNNTNIKKNVQVMDSGLHHHKLDLRV